ncbi:hypothetical protein Tdes44962_MAKER00339 [Teratosphaeria destructans]|uniref:Uncharacterized protein n=1 Tax=Teratosphaeria destructans TaxID=418781 RepID=A0A9W7SS62_9PEZI|nr:hypothetical protein Tdes44962_MAKER00339 [Teratosphaeria destructans]
MPALDAVEFLLAPWIAVEAPNERQGLVHSRDVVVEAPEHTVLLRRDTVWCMVEWLEPSSMDLRFEVPGLGEEVALLHVAEVVGSTPGDVVGFVATEAQLDPSCVVEHADAVAVGQATGEKQGDVSGCVFGEATRAVDEIPGDEGLPAAESART